MCITLLSSFVRNSRFVFCSNLRPFLRNNSSPSNLSLQFSFRRNDCRSVSYAHDKIDYKKDNVDPYVCLKLIRLIKLAIRENGPILERNEKLANVLKRAEEYNIPFDFIDHSLRISKDNRTKLGIFEMLYLNHGCFVVQYEDIDTSNTKHHLMQICEKYDAYFTHEPTKWTQYFNPKGILCVESKKSLPIMNEKEAKEIASKVGVKSVKKELDFENWLSWQFHCEPANLHEVKKKLQEENYEIDEAYVGLIPKRNVPLPSHAKRVVHSIISTINKIPVIDNVYHNILL